MTFATGLLIWSSGVFSMQAQNVTVGVGLDIKKNVLIQEYWKDGASYFAIANSGKIPAEVSFREWADKKPGRNLLGPVAVGVNELVVVAAKPTEGRELVAVTIDDGTLLGLLRAPAKFGGADAAGITTPDGLNGLGGRRGDLWGSQENKSIAPGGDIRLRITVPDGIGTIRFPKTQSLGSFPASTLKGVSSESLPIEEDEKGFVIDASKGRESRKSHVIVLDLKATSDEKATMLAIQGRVTTPEGGGFSIVRGIPLALPSPK